MSFSEQYMNMAEYFATYHLDRIRDLKILPPYESKDKGRQGQSQWVRGSIRHSNYDHVLRELVVTGPKMKICFGGCNWNRLVFAMSTESQDVVDFRSWLGHLGHHVKASVWAEPGKFKPGAISSSRFTFEEDFIKPANDPTRYPDELRCKISTRREVGLDGTMVDVADANFFTTDASGESYPIEPHQITSGSYMIPVIKLSYYRNGEKFGLNATVLKGLVYPMDRPNYQVENSAWVIDYPNPN